MVACRYWHPALVTLDGPAQAAGVWGVHRGTPPVQDAQGPHVRHHQELQAGTTQLCQARDLWLKLYSNL